MGSGGNKQPPPPSATPAITAVQQPTVFEQIAADRLKKFTDWENAPGAHDITTAPGIGDMMDIYGNADSIAAEKRLGGNPAKALSGAGSGDYQAQLEEQGRNDRYKQRAEGLSHGLQSIKAEAYGLGGDASQIESQRKRDYANLMLQQQEDYYRRPQKRSLFDKIAGLAIGGAQAYFGGGG